MSTPHKAYLTHGQLHAILLKYVDTRKDYHQCDSAARTEALREAVETIPVLYVEVDRLRVDLAAALARAEKAEAGICERTVFCDVKDAMADLLERAEKAEARSKELREWGRKKHERIKELKQYLREMHIRAANAGKPGGAA